MKHKIFFIFFLFFFKLITCKHKKENNAYSTVVSKATVVLHRWGRETQNFGFMN